MSLFLSIPGCLSYCVVSGTVFPQGNLRKRLREEILLLPQPMCLKKAHNHSNILGAKFRTRRHILHSENRRTYQRRTPSLGILQCHLLLLLVNLKTCKVSRHGCYTNIVEFSDNANQSYVGRCKVQTEPRAPNTRHRNAVTRARGDQGQKGLSTGAASRDASRAVRRVVWNILVVLTRSG